MKKSQAIKAINEISYKTADSMLGLIKFKYLIPESLDSVKTEKEILIYLSELREGDDEINKRVVETWREDVAFIDTLPDILYPMILVYSITIFEAFLTDITKVLMTYFWKTLRSNSRTMTYEEILAFDDMPALREQIVENDIMSFSYSSLKDRINYLEKKLSLKFSYVRVKGIRNNWNCVEMEPLTEIHAARNLIVHNAGIVNKIYLNQIKNSTYKLNDPLKIDKTYMLDSLSLLFRVRSSFTSVALDKIKI